MHDFVQVLMNNTHATIEIMPKVNHYAKEETEKESAVFRIEKYFRLIAWMYGYGLAATFHLSSSSPPGFLCLLLRYMYIIKCAEMNNEGWNCLNHLLPMS